MKKARTGRIIVATDGSPTANRAIDTAARLAKCTNSELVILTVGGSVSGAELRRLADTQGDLSKLLEESVDKILTQAGKRAQRLGVTAKLQREWGDPAEMLIDTARRQKADMIVVGRRGRGRLSALLLGGVSQKVASLADCVVVVVP